jgi:hypothetical protein
VTQPPSVTSSGMIWGAALINVNHSTSTAGYPAPQLTLYGLLPSGLRFTDHGDGLASISGSPEFTLSDVPDIFEFWKTLYNSTTASVTATNSAGRCTRTITLNTFPWVR